MSRGPSSRMGWDGSYFSGPVPNYGRYAAKDSLSPSLWLFGSYVCDLTQKHPNPVKDNVYQLSSVVSTSFYSCEHLEYRCSHSILASSREPTIRQFKGQSVGSGNCA